VVSSSIGNNGVTFGRRVMMDRYATITVTFKNDTDTTLLDAVDAIEALSEDVIVAEASWNEV